MYTLIVYQEKPVFLSAYNTKKTKSSVMLGVASMVQQATKSSQCIWGIKPDSRFCVTVKYPCNVSCEWL